MSILKPANLRVRTCATALLVAVAFALVGCDVDVEEEATPAADTNTTESAALADRDSTYGGGDKAPEPVYEEEYETVCADCGTVVNIEEVKAKGEATGLGAVIGGVAGAVAGRQVGGGTGKDIATVAGAVGGAAAGHEIEKRSRGEVYYLVTVAMDAGGQQSVELVSVEGVRIGDEVEIDGNNLIVRG